MNRHCSVSLWLAGHGPNVAVASLTELLVSDRCRKPLLGLSFRNTLENVVCGDDSALPDQ